MDEVSIQLENGNKIQIFYSSNSAFAEECDSCIGYNIFDETGEEIDGGALDYNCSNSNYDEDICNAIADVILLHYDKPLAYTIIED